jgi:hypothetical protein
MTEHRSKNWMNQHPAMILLSVIDIDELNRRGFEFTTVSELTRSPR